MDKHSGRDGDKAKAFGLKMAYSKNVTPYFEESDAVIECEIMCTLVMLQMHRRNKSLPI